MSPRYAARVLLYWRVSVATLKVVIGLVVASLVMFGVVAGIRVATLLDRDLEVARSEALAAKRVADSVVKATAVTKASADSVRKAAAVDRSRADRLARQAVALEQELGRLEAAYALASSEAPDTCATLIAQADSVLEQAGVAVLQWRAVAITTRRAFDGLARAYDSVAAANVALQRATEDLSARTGALARAGRVSFFQRLVPKPQFGVTAGLDVTGRPAAVIGIGLGWAF